MATVRDLSCVLDPQLFTFKPKLNQKSNEIAQNLLSNFYQRQIQHMKRLQELHESGGVEQHRSTTQSREKRQKQVKIPVENKSEVDDSIVNDENCHVENETNESMRAPDRIERMMKIYRSSVGRKSGSIVVPNEARNLKTLSRRSAPAFSAAAPIPENKEENVENLTAPSFNKVFNRLSRRTSPPVRSKSPSKSTNKQQHRNVDASPKRPLLNENVNIERLKNARDEADRAIKEHKVFMIIGPYPALREALRRRGWVEKFDRSSIFPSNSSKKNDRKTKSDDDDDDENLDELNDDDLDENPMNDDDDRIPPWEENDGYYGILSRLVKSVPADFIWSVAASYDTSTLNKDQMVNHYSRNGCLTTKVGLCSSLKNLPWFHEGCSEEFYPRCYKLSNEDDKTAFIEDYRLTCCISFLRLIDERSKGIREADFDAVLSTNSELNSNIVELNSARPRISSNFVEFAVKKVQEFFLFHEHEDIDENSTAQNETTDEQWTQFIEQFYSATQTKTEIEGTERFLGEIGRILKSAQNLWPQFSIDGTRNIWILKPGAKSRGRGIVVYDRLDDILKLCASTLISDRKFVVQKYIERPLLIHNTKFDIRQWFLVTDWNPLTIWMYKDCYFRFCTEHFSLATRQQNVHLCNYSIQKHFKNNVNRHEQLPTENMWKHDEFIENYLKPNNLEEKWESLIYPSMKDAIVCSMLVAQDSIDTRKNSFELFGADFMLGEDLKPWLIEINCSPTMARCTAVTTELCDNVLEDTCKVMIDRKYSRSNDTGRFELIHKGQPVTVPSYVGIDLRVEGKTYKTGRTNQSKIVSSTVDGFQSKSPSTVDIDHENTSDHEDTEIFSDGSQEKSRVQDGPSRTNLTEKSHSRLKMKRSERISVDNFPVPSITRIRPMEPIHSNQVETKQFTRQIHRSNRRKFRLQKQKNHSILSEQENKFSPLIISKPPSINPD